MRLVALLTAAAAALTVSAPPAAAQQARMEQVPPRQVDEGEGPYRKLVIRGGLVIKGDGSPPIGPVDVVVEGNRITSMQSAGTPGVPAKPTRPPHDATKEIDATGMWIMPGFIDTHGHN